MSEIIYETTATVTYQLSPRDLRFADPILNKYHTGRETFPLDEVINCQELLDASYQIKRQHEVEVTVQVMSDGTLRIKELQ